MDKLLKKVELDKYYLEKTRTSNNFEVLFIYFNEVKYADIYGEKR